MFFSIRCIYKPSLRFLNKKKKLIRFSGSLYFALQLFSQQSTKFFRPVEIESNHKESCIKISCNIFFLTPSKEIFPKIYSLHISFPYTSTVAFQSQLSFIFYKSRLREHIESRAIVPVPMCARFMVFGISLIIS